MVDAFYLLISKFKSLYNINLHSFAKIKTHYITFCFCQIAEFIRMFF
ncbi:hypothetical protein FEM08_33950 [Flavobacterium gilvum]|nr:hypothetical protein FEM08_33950 [Flavobacterium gilvum]